MRARFNDQYQLYDYTNAFPDHFQSNTQCLGLLINLLRKSGCKKTHVFGQKGYGAVSTLREDPSHLFRCEFEHAHPDELTKLAKRLGCKTVYQTEGDKYVLFVNEEILYQKLQKRLIKACELAEIDSKIEQGQHKEFEYVDNPSEAATLNEELNDMGMCVVHDRIPHLNHSVLAIKVHDFDRFICETSPGLYKPRSESKDISLDSKRDKDSALLKSTKGPRAISSFCTSFFSPPSQSTIKLLTESEEEKKNLAALRGLIHELKNEINSFWSFAYNTSLKQFKINYLEKIIENKYLTNSSLKESVVWANRNVLGIEHLGDRSYRTKYTYKDAISGKYLHHRVKDCIDTILHPAKQSAPNLRA